MNFFASEVQSEPLCDGKYLVLYASLVLVACNSTDFHQKYTWNKCKGIPALVIPGPWALPLLPHWKPFLICTPFISIFVEAIARRASYRNRLVARIGLYERSLFEYWLLRLLPLYRLSYGLQGTLDWKVIKGLMVSPGKKLPTSFPSQNRLWNGGSSANGQIGLIVDRPGFLYQGLLARKQT